MKETGSTCNFGMENKGNKKINQIFPAVTDLAD